MTDKIQADIKSLKIQKRLLINQVNKTKKEYDNIYKEKELEIKNKLEKKYKDMEAKAQTEHNKIIKKLTEQQEKINKRANKRDARRNKTNPKENEKLNKIIKEQVEKLKEKKNQLKQKEKENKDLLMKLKEQENIYNELKNELKERGEKVNLKTFGICRDVIQNCIDKVCKKDMSVQCNLVQEEKLAHIEKATTIQSSNINNDHYIISYFKTIDRKNNKRINKVCYINENMDIRYRREMLAVLDTDNDIYKMIFKSKFKESICIRLYSEKQYMAIISYNFNQSKQNVFCITSYKGEEFGRIPIDIELNSEYRIEINSYNSIYSVKFNGELIGEIKMEKEIKFFTSNANFNVIYN